MDITVIVFVLSMVVIGLLLTSAIRRDFVKQKRLAGHVRRQVGHARARRGAAHKP